MTVCVCGCPHVLHREITLSVPLVRGRPDTEREQSLAIPYNTFVTSTYVRDDCTVCGCGQFIEDTGDVVAVAAVG